MRRCPCADALHVPRTGIRPAPRTGGNSRTPRAATRLLLALAVLAPVGGLAWGISGCGSSGVTFDAVAQAAAATSATGGVRMQFIMQISSGALASSLTAEGQGVYDYKTREGSLSLTMNGLPASASAGLPSGSLQIEELMKPSAIYVGSPLFAERLPNGARWMKIDLGQVGGALGMDLASPTNGQSNPAQFLEYLRADGGDVSSLGQEVVDGVPTTRYRGTIDLQKLAQTLPQAARSHLQPELEKVAQQGIPFEVWVDRHHLVRRMTMSFSIDASGQSVQMQSTIDLSGFGATPAVQAPPEAEVYDGTQAALQGLGAAGTSAG